LRSRIAVFASFVQIILLSGHWVLYQTLTAFQVIPDRYASASLAIFALLAMSFIPATILSLRHANFWARGFYKLSATWLGFLHFGFLASICLWTLSGIGWLAGAGFDRSPPAMVLFGLAIAAGMASMINAASIRVHRVTVRLPNLPASWNGRTAALISDLHLGHVRGRGFIQRIVRMLTGLKPDLVFIAGDLFDGAAVDVAGLVQPWREFSAPLGVYFIAGNHEEFSDPNRYLDALKQSGIRVLNNEKTMADGMQIVGVHYRDAADGRRFNAILEQAGLDRKCASILLAHTPEHLEIVEKAGVSLQLSGHTHAGQLFPFTWIVSRIYGPFAYGLNRFGNLMVYTSCGAGTWGAPMRLGTRPEIVLIRFE
jgi:predicted MPP superfamily phosphohydrolase